MKSKNLSTIWSRPDSSRLAPKQISVRLPVHVMARIRALEEMYPTRTRTEIISDLLSAALDEMESGLPMIRGMKQNFRDPESGEDLYDVGGPAYEYRVKANRHYKEIEQELGNEAPLDLFGTDLVDVASAFDDGK